MKTWFFKVYSSNSRKGIRVLYAETTAYDSKQARKKIRKLLKLQHLKMPTRIPKNPGIRRDHLKHYTQAMMSGLTVPARKWWTI